MRLILCWLGIWIFCVGLFAQNTKDNSSYLFDEFQDCLIVYKDGRQFTAPVNYGSIMSLKIRNNKKRSFLIRN